MADIVLHSRVAVAIERLVLHKPHAVLLSGSQGGGKRTLAGHIAARLLDLDDEHFENYPYKMVLVPEQGTVLTIEQIRALQQTVSLKVPGKKSVARIVMIMEAHMMSVEAQNALLKTLEEPPLDTIILMTTNRADALLPTIHSRVATVHVLAPEPEQIEQWFLAKGHSREKIAQASMVSGGLPGLMTALLTESTTHPLSAAIEQARTILVRSSYERLLLVDELSKQRQSIIDVLFVLTQMARTALIRGAGQSADSARWTRVLKACYTAERQLSRNVQAKLVLTRLMLEL